jgi:hypothetical protein
MQRGNLHPEVYILENTPSPHRISLLFFGKHMDVKRGKDKEKT